MAVTSNYSGRTTDLFIFQGAALGGDRPIYLGFGGTTGGQVTTGIQKLSQTFAILLLTERGSVPDNPDWGTNLLAAVRTGGVRNETDVKAIVSLAIEQSRSLLGVLAEQQTLPDDETFKTATLQSFRIDEEKSTLTLYIKVTSAAGETRDIVLPVPVPIY